MSRSEFEEILFVPASEREMAEMELVGECMRRQGFDFQPSLEAREPQVLDPLPGVNELNERIERIGSGLVAATQLQLQLENELEIESGPSAESTDPEEVSDETPAYQLALSGEAIVDGETIDGGCIAWATNEYLNRNPDERLRIEVEEDYASKLASAHEDGAMAVLDDEWASCMAARGFDGLSELGDHYTSIRRRINEALNSGDESERDLLLDAALEFDIEISAANLDCFGQIEERREAVLADYYSRFLQEYDASVSVLIRQTGQ